METREKRYSTPDDYTVINKNGWFIFFDPLYFSYTRVNEHGKAILEAVDKETSAAEVARKVGPQFGFDPDDIEGQVSAFLENMISTGFLHEGPYKIPVEDPEKGRMKPSTLYIHPTFKCTLKCIYCYNKEDRKESDNTEMSSEEWFEVLDQAKDMDFDNIVFTGGEPLLRKDTFEIGKYANSIGLKSQILTNGMLVNNDNIKDIVNTFASVGLSLDSHIRETNDFLRGKGAYDANINTIKLLKECEHPFTIKAVITKYNVEDIPDYYRFFFEQFNCGNINAGLYVPTSMNDTDLLPDLEVYRKSMTRANQIVDEFYGEDKFSELGFHGIPMKQNQCGAASGELAIAPNGSVYPCQALLKPEFDSGNIKENKLRDIYYDSPIMQKVRNCTVDNIEICRDCDIKGICTGGCRSLAYNLYGKIDCHNAYSCETLREVAETVLWKASCVPIEKLKELREKTKIEDSAQV